jgi:hypothetical protein
MPPTGAATTVPGDSAKPSRRHCCNFHGIPYRIEADVTGERRGEDRSTGG